MVSTNTWLIMYGTIIGYLLAYLILTHAGLDEDLTSRNADYSKKRGYFQVAQQ